MRGYVLQQETEKNSQLLVNKEILQEINQAKYYFGFIEEKDLGDKIEMSFLSNSGDYIGKWILSLLDNVEVIEPEFLNDDIVKMVKKLQNKYNPS